MGTEIYICRQITVEVGTAFERKKPLLKHAATSSNINPRAVAAVLKIGYVIFL